MILGVFYQPLVDAAETILVFFHNQLGFGWGMSIVGLTIVTRLAILPLTLKQLRSMQALQRLQPQLKEIQEKYKADRQRMQQEMMKFYRENKVNPLASCFPLLLQLPVFLSLFYLLRHDLKPHLEATVTAGGTAGWLMWEDLSKAATGIDLAVLIVLYVATQLGAGLVMSVTADRNQRIMMFALPFVFVPLIVKFPSGLIIYWITTNAWTIGQQYAVRRFLPPPTTAAGAAAPAGAAAAVKAPPPPPPKKKKRSGRRR